MLEARFEIDDRHSRAARDQTAQHTTHGGMRAA
jgi:hypothetical protein